MDEVLIAIEAVDKAGSKEAWNLMQIGYWKSL